MEERAFLDTPVRWQYLEHVMDSHCCSLPEIFENFGFIDRCRCTSFRGRWKNSWFTSHLSAPLWITLTNSSSIWSLLFEMRRSMDSCQNLVVDDSWQQLLTTVGTLHHFMVSFLHLSAQTRNYSVQQSERFQSFQFEYDKQHKQNDTMCSGFCSMTLNPNIEDYCKNATFDAKKYWKWRLDSGGS